VEKILFFVLSIVYFAFSLTNEEIKKYYWQSYNFEKMQNYEDAIKALMPIYDKYPNGYTVNLRLGWLYYIKGNYRNSIYHYKKAMKIFPYSLEAKLGYTLPLLAQRKYKDAVDMCYQILKIDFYNYYGNLRLSFALRELKDYTNAHKVVSKMLALYPTDTNFLVELGIIYYKTNDLSKAKKIFNDVLILDPINIKAKRYLEKISKKEEMD